MRVGFWAGGLLMGTAFLAACAGGISGSGPGGLTDGAASTASCQSLDDVSSYRYTISLGLTAPAFQSTDDGASDPIGAFASELTALFSDMRLEGAYVAPDRSQTVLAFEDTEMELRSIGDRSWIRIGSTWQEQASSPDSNGLLTPDDVCRDVVRDLAPSLDDLEPQSETVNGMETDHYRLDETDLVRLPDLLGAEPGSHLPESYAVDVWLSRDGNWPVRLQIFASDTDEDGRPLELELSMEFRDIDDPTISIEPPTVSPPEPRPTG